MVLRYSKLTSIAEDRKIRKGEDYDSWFYLEQGLLAALLESGTLNPMQYRMAREALQAQRTDRARRLLEEESE